MAKTDGKIKHTFVHNNINSNDNIPYIRTYMHTYNTKADMVGLFGQGDFQTKTEGFVEVRKSDISCPSVMSHHWSLSYFLEVVLKKNPRHFREHYQSFTIKKTHLSPQ